MSGRDPPRLTVKFWPPSVMAEGVPAINAIRKPLAFAVYARPVVLCIFGLAAMFGGHEYLSAALRLIKSW
jgi:hypothetical protein